MDDMYTRIGSVFHITQKKKGFLSAHVTKIII